MGQDSGRVGCGWFAQIRTMGVQVGCGSRNGNNSARTAPNQAITHACTRQGSAPGFLLTDLTWAARLLKAGGTLPPSSAWALGDATFRSEDSRF
jgi:hypothetical protein